MSKEGGCVYCGALECRCSERPLTPFGGERAVFPCVSCGSDVAIAVIMGDPSSAWADGDIEFRCSPCELQRMAAVNARLVEAGDALAIWVEDGFTGTTSRALATLESWRLAKGDQKLKKHDLQSPTKGPQ